MRHTGPYKFLPIALGFLGLLFGAGCYWVESHPIDSSLHLLYWGIFFVLQVMVGYFIGLLFQRLHLAAYTDALTKLWNRRYFYEYAGRALSGHTLGNTAFCLFMIDLDNFKCVNDTRGHQAGDELLIELAAKLRQHTRPSDITARMGGDEFALLLPSISFDTGIDIAERIRQAVENHLAAYGATVSIGVAYDKGVVSVDRLISTADQALYQAKVSRNLVMPQVSEVATTESPLPIMNCSVSTPSDSQIQSQSPQSKT